ncbi:DMT family transporter [Thermoflavimicrobium daqui]|uniref:DMT family transporter n=1 Tax=Thermoflavimicrobium daqui TaxID=2137476 RepID=A0A364K9A7_9BACL|nr:DMT family transporter [Thermoflavimicrobium daqui]RAL26886.1 hypothetical protein DL897_02230 [Thermoflavimicrobium daqui]
MRVNLFLISIAICAGVASAIQAGVNGALGKKVGVIEAAFVSFLVGACTLLVLMLIFGKGELGEVFSVPKWQLIGGVFGAVFILCMVITVPQIGVASTLVAIIVGQIFTSTLIDHFGLLGGKQIPIDGYRLAGLALMAIALFLFYRKA